VTIDGGQFTIIGGDQNNTTNVNVTVVINHHVYSRSRRDRTRLVPMVVNAILVLIVISLLFIIITRYVQQKCDDAYFLMYPQIIEGLKCVTYNVTY
jgi:hypothetical protein